MLKANRVLMAIAAMILSLGLTGCGKDKYEGNYTGVEMRSMTQAGTTPTPTQQQTQARQVTLTLTSNGDSVTGTYTPAPLYNGGMNGSVNGSSETYQLTANSSNSGQLTNVMIFPAPGNTMNSGCVIQGTLASQDHGQTLSGTLSGTGGYNNGYNNGYNGGFNGVGMGCPSSLQINLTRTN